MQEQRHTLMSSFAGWFAAAAEGDLAESTSVRSLNAARLLNARPSACMEALEVGAASSGTFNTHGCL